MESGENRERIVPVTECTRDHIPPIVSEQDNTSITSFSSDKLLSPDNPLLYAFITSSVVSSFEPTSSYEPRIDHLENVRTVAIGDLSFFLPPSKSSEVSDIPTPNPLASHNQLLCARCRVTDK